MIFYKCRKTRHSADVCGEKAMSKSILNDLVKRCDFCRCNGYREKNVFWRKSHSAVPCINILSNEIEFKEGKILTRAIPCIEENESLDQVMSIYKKYERPLALDEVIVRPANEEDRQKLFKIMNEYPDCFAQK